MIYRLLGELVIGEDGQADPPSGFTLVLLATLLVNANQPISAANETASLRNALALWRGPHPLSNVPGETLPQERAMLEQRRKRAAVRLFTLELALGNAESILDQLILVASYYPSDRRLCELLMLAAYRCGHLADVATAYERYREALAEETGAAPDQLLRTFHFAIGRGDDLAARYPDGQLYAELRGSAGGPADTSQILAQFLRAFADSRVPESMDERLAAYRTLLAGRRVLIMLDDAADGSQASDLVPANQSCAVLVTARHRLPEVSGAHHVPPLLPLQPADATELFVRSVQDAGISLSGDLDAVADVVALCGGLPLALRIASALRVQAHPRPTAELADRLARQGPAAFSYGNLNLARTIGAGLDRLDAAARQFFFGLGLLDLTSFGRWTAVALLVGRPAAAADEAMMQLAANFMIEPREPEQRYRFHDLTREYARQRARADYPGERRLVPARAYGALLTLTRHAHRRLYGGDFEVIHSAVPDW